MPLTNAYCTVDALRGHLEDTDERLPAELLERAINAASRAVDNHTGTQFHLDDTPTARVFTTTDCGELLVDPFGSLTGLVISSDDAGDRTYSAAWPVTDFWPMPHNGPVWTRLTRDKRGGRYFSTCYPTQVTARWGYPSTPVEVEEATLLKAAGLFGRKDSPYGVATYGDFAAVRITRADPDVIELLRTYVLDVAMVG
jgi:hypothetical protein